MEKFNPKESYEVIRNMPVGPEKDKEKQAFHETRIKQKTEIATVAALLLEEITANPDIDRNVLVEAVKAQAPEMKLGSRQTKIFKEMINVYAKRHEQIKKLQESPDNPREIFKIKFGTVSKGNVRVIFGPIVTHFILSDVDYDKITNEKTEKNQRTKISGGQFWPSRPDITIARASSWADESIRKHEESHALKHMFDKVLGIERFDWSFRNKQLPQLKEKLVAAKDPRVKAHIAEDVLRGYIYENGERIKDEIFANIRQGGSGNIVETLARSSKHLGLYDYTERDRKEITDFMEEKISFADRVYVNDALKGFNALNKACIGDAVNVVSTLATTHGFTPDMIFFFLNDVPLSLWKKEISRLKK